MIKAETYLDSHQYKTEFNSMVYATLVKVERTFHTDYQVNVMQKFSIIFERRDPIVFGTEAAARSYFNDIKAGRARPF